MSSLTFSAISAGAVLVSGAMRCGFSPSSRVWTPFFPLEEIPWSHGVPDDDLRVRVVFGDAVLASGTQTFVLRIRIKTARRLLIGGTAEEYAVEGHQRQAVSRKIFRSPSTMNQHQLIPLPLLINFDPRRAIPSRRQNIFVTNQKAFTCHQH